MNRQLLLHVEDDPDDALLIGRALRRAGVENPVHVVENGEQAVRYMLGQQPFEQRSGQPLPGLILLDLNTPLMTGHEFLQWLRSQPLLRRIPVVVLTSSSAERDIIAAYDAGANAYLVKPLDQADLVAMLRDLQSFWFNWNQTQRLERGAAT
jgi:CheY-like chemotaxis protein